MTMDELAAVRILRFDPSSGAEPRYDTYHVPYRNRMVLDVLCYIFENCDPTLCFRSGCRTGSCDGCLVMLNGRPAVACQTPAQRDMMIEPLPRFKVVRDLVPDFAAPKGGHQASDLA